MLWLQDDDDGDDDEDEDDDEDDDEDENDNDDDYRYIYYKSIRTLTYLILPPHTHFQTPLHNTTLTMITLNSTTTSPHLLTTPLPITSSTIPPPNYPPYSSGCIC